MWWKYTQSIKTIEIPGRKIIHFSRTIWPRLICVFWLNIAILLYYHWSTLATVNWIFAELPTDAESRTISSDLPLIRKMHQKIVNATNCISILQVKHSETLSNMQKKNCPAFLYCLLRIKCQSQGGEMTQFSHHSDIFSQN